MSSNERDDLSLPPFGDTSSSSESATLEPDSPEIAGGEKKADKIDKALVTQAKKATVKENPLTDTTVSILRNLALSKQILKRSVLKEQKEKLLPPGTAVQTNAKPDKKLKKKRTKQSLKIFCS